MQRNARLYKQKKCYFFSTCWKKREGNARCIKQNTFYILRAQISTVGTAYFMQSFLRARK